MEDLAKVRLVRCPKCENLLPELADYSVYQCGGCGAVLRAKDKTYSRGSNSFSDKAAEEERGNSLNSEGSLESRVVDSVFAMDVDAKSNSGCDPRELLMEDGSEKCQNQSQVAGEECIYKNSLDLNADRERLVKSSGRENPDCNSIFASAKASKISHREFGRRNSEIGEIDGCQRNLRTEMEDVTRFSSSKYTNDVPSNFYPGSSYSYGDKWRRHKDHCDAAKAQHLEEDRAEILRKLDELKDQLNRSCHLVDKPKDKFPSVEMLLPPDSCGRSGALVRDASSGLKRLPIAFSDAHKHAAGPSYINGCHDLFSNANNSGTSAHHFPGTSSQHSNYLSGYQDPFGPQMLRRASRHFPSQFPQQPHHPYLSGQYLNSSDPFTHSDLLHHPCCACFYCSEAKQLGSVQIPPATFTNRRFPHAANDHLPYRHEIPGQFGPLHNFRTTIPIANLRETQKVMTSFMQNHPQKVMLACGSSHCCPVAGGAPFLACFSCFELLHIPYKALDMVRSHNQKVRCGACSGVMTLSVVNRKLVISLHSESNGMLTEFVHSSDKDMKKHRIDSHRHNWSVPGVNFSSDDYDNSGFDFQSIDKEPSLERILDSRNPQEMQDLHSSSPSSSGNGNSPEVFISTAPQIVQAVLSPPPGSPLEEYFDHSSKQCAINRFGKGNQSSRSEQEKAKMNKATSRQNSLKESILATEVEVPFKEYSDNCVTQDSGDVRRENDQPRHNKGSESFFTNVIKKSFKDFTRFNQSDERGKGMISVNGHIIQDRMLKKAEKLAGPIQPGNYWYDAHAGFWGAMGGPCLGIIPPLIEELNYTMPKHCAGGNTGVFVNGRELHQSDLGLLAGRGLPMESNRSYVIEISGRVFDEDTGEELDSLGKLAPTVEKVKHGFGMKPPRSAS